MAGIKQPILDLLTLLATVPGIVHTRIWNNQLEHTRQAEEKYIPLPAAFVEVVPGVQFEALTMGMTSADIVFRIHLVHEYYDAQNGTFEQDLAVFDLRDAIMAKLTLFQPTACTPLTFFSEEQDYDHDNLYHYVMDFACNFTDSKGSPLDPDSGKFIVKNPPTGIVVNATLVDNITGEEPNTIFPHPGYRPYIPQK
jgi:hypothetical protein